MLRADRWAELERRAQADAGVRDLPAIHRRPISLRCWSTLFAAGTDGIAIDMRGATRWGRPPKRTGAGYNPSRHGTWPAPPRPAVDASSACLVTRGRGLEPPAAGGSADDACPSRSNG